MTMPTYITIVPAAIYVLMHCTYLILCAAIWRLFLINDDDADNDDDNTFTTVCKELIHRLL